MPNNDIEEFLRRAAQRRQAKSSQAPASSPPSVSARPEYTSAKSERIPRNRDDEAPIQAVLVDEDVFSESVADHMKGLSKKRAQTTKQSDERRAGGTVKPVEPPSMVSGDSFYVAKERAPSVAPQTVVGDASGFTVADRLVTMLRQPEGMMQAILLQEILKRPEDRW